MIAFGSKNKYLDYSGVQNDSDATLSYYINMEGYSFMSIQYIEGTNDGVQTLKVYASNENIRDATLADYTDVTNDWFGNTVFNTSAWLEKDTTSPVKFIKIEMAVTGMIASDTSVWSLFVTKKSR